MPVSKSIWVGGPAALSVRLALLSNMSPVFRKEVRPRKDQCTHCHMQCLDNTHRPGSGLQQLYAGCSAERILCMLWDSKKRPKAMVATSAGREHMPLWSSLETALAKQTWQIQLPHLNIAAQQCLSTCNRWLPKQDVVVLEMGDAHKGISSCPTHHVVLRSSLLTCCSQVHCSQRDNACPCLLLMLASVPGDHDTLTRFESPTAGLSNPTWPVC